MQYLYIYEDKTSPVSFIRLALDAVVQVLGSKSKY
jgi:hypothetical protein